MRPSVPSAITSRVKTNKCSKKPKVRSGKGVPIPLTTGPEIGSDKNFILTCATRAKKALEGNYMMYEVESIDVLGKNVLTVWHIKDYYCTKPTNECQFRQLWKTLLEQKVKDAPDQKIKDYVHQIDVRPWVPPFISWSVYEMGCADILNSARDEGFKYVRIAEVKKPCKTKLLIKTPIRQICNYYVAHGCDQNELTITRE